MDEPTGPSEIERQIIEDARKIIGEINGSPINGFQHAWRRLKASDQTDAKKFVVQVYREALKVDEEWRRRAVIDLLNYKEHWGPKFERARLANRTLPSVYPDPADILILSDVSFRFIGPVTEAEARDWQFFRQGREAFFLIAREIIDGAGHFYTVEDGHARWAKLRRHFYRVNRHLPDIFKRKYPARFPAFKPTAVWRYANDPDEIDSPDRPQGPFVPPGD